MKIPHTEDVYEVKMRKNANVITSKQLIFIIVSSTVGVGILTLADSAGEVAQQDAWISVAMGALLPLVGLVAIVLNCSKFPGLTLAEYSERILGKWLGKLISLVFVFYTIVTAAIITSTFVHMLKIYLFPATPRWALVVLILSVITYWGSKDARVLGRVNELMFYEAIIVFLSLVLAFPNIDLTFYQPIGHAGISNILIAASKTIFAYTGMELLLVFYHMVQNKKETVKAGLTAITIVLFIYLGITITALGVFGPFVIGKVRFSLMVLLKTYTAPLIERTEFFFVIFYVFVAFRPIGNYYFASRYTAEKMLGLNAPGLITIVIFPIALAVASYPDSFEQTVAISSQIGIVGLVFLIIVPLLLWFISLIRGIDGEKDQT
ncbi:spore germination protein [Desulforamulus reducens MI-1]|uniref:Spore germination protein n=1 Tax=Desulforamulus reducens (strain ATCC BAA-1160 / DSM 100696 / MI-1) TaxID=349161 RepID=A4J7W8_DESRM|nr:endospore germination permease [Desulforamulus reducens]ABO51171.1 spore germination protein [Desulforamulus reducens MI-1]